MMERFTLDLNIGVFLNVDSIVIVLGETVSSFKTVVQIRKAIFCALIEADGKEIATAKMQRKKIDPTRANKSASY